MPGEQGPFEIRALYEGDAHACVSIVQSLPEWFGYPSAIEDVAAASRTQEGFVAVEGADVIAFVTTRPSFDESLEITYLAVEARHRRGGAGRALVRQVAELGRSRGYASVNLLTLGPSSGSSHYAQTVAFYRALGFWRVKEVQLSSWGGASALVMVAPVATLCSD